MDARLPVEQVALILVQLHAAGAAPTTALDALVDAVVMNNMRGVLK